MLIPHAQVIAKGGLSLKMNDKKFAEEGENIPSLFLIKTTATSILGYGPKFPRRRVLRLFDKVSGLDGVPVGALSLNKEEAHASRSYKNSGVFEVQYCVTFLCEIIDYLFLCLQVPKDSLVILSLARGWAGPFSSKPYIPRRCYLLVDNIIPPQK